MVIMQMFLLNEKSRIPMGVFPCYPNIAWKRMVKMVITDGDMNEIVQLEETIPKCMH